MRWPTLLSPIEGVLDVLYGSADLTVVHVVGRRA